ncbi:MAG TPA: M23 family metallopeptidase, partial [Candidatus Binatia bacterium]
MVITLAFIVTSICGASIQVALAHKEHPSWSYMFARLAVTLAVTGIINGNALASHSGFPVAITAGPLPQPVVVNSHAHLVYELHLTNVAPIPVELLTLDIFGDDASQPLASYRDEALQKLLAPAQNLLTSVTPQQAAKARTIAEGGSVVVFLDLVQETKALPPHQLHHRFSFSIRGNPDLERTINGPDIAVIHDPLPILHPPLHGPGWIAFNALANYDHRRAFQTIDGKLCIAQRFAIDWVRLGADGRLFKGDSKSNKNFYGYGAEVLAVADGRISEVRDTLPDNGGSNERSTRHVTVDSAVGNYVTLDLGQRHFALYAHLQPGSIKVRVGDQVKTGQVLGLLGNSGNSDAPHLHFQVTDDNSPLGGEGLPYELTDFTQIGTVGGAEALLDSGQAWRGNLEDKPVEHREEFPMNNAVV